MRHEEGRTRVALADALAALGRVEEAQAELRATVRSATERGAAFEARAAREALSGLGARTLRPEHVKEALEALHEPAHLRLSALGRLVGIDPDSLHRLVVDQVERLAASGSGREREAGQLLRDYYVRRVGSQEVVAERLHLTRPTFYRRLHLGWALLARKLVE
jgi:hypothetical protein